MRKISRTRARFATAAATVAGFAIVGAALATTASAAPASVGALAGPATATETAAPSATPTGMPTGMTSYRFTTLDNGNDVTFNQLLGINDKGEIAGYFGSEAAGHPNKGSKLFGPYGQGSNRGYTFNIRTKRFTRVLVPGYPAGTAGPSLTASAINNRGDVAGFYTDAAGNTDGLLATVAGHRR
jgi:hypothetical protein